MSEKSGRWTDSQEGASDHSREGVVDARPGEVLGPLVVGEQLEALVLVLGHRDIPPLARLGQHPVNEHPQGLRQRLLHLLPRESGLDMPHKCEELNVKGTGYRV